MDLFAINLLSPIFYRLLFMSLTAIAIGLLVYLVRCIFDKKISPLWKYLLWGLVLIGLSLPYRPQSPVSLMGSPSAVIAVSYRQEELSARRALTLYKTQYQEIGDHDPAYQAQLQAQIKALHAQSVLFEIVLPMVWFFGLLVALAWMILSKIALYRKIKGHSVSTTDFSEALEDCKLRLHCKGNIEIITQTYLLTPAITGIVRPKIILPSYSRALPRGELVHILLHELGHFKRGDLLVNQILLVLQAIHWFNPLVWLCFKLIREDMELANDSYVLSKMDSGEQKKYARSLVTVLGYSNQIPLMPKLLCMVDGKKNIERRLSMMKLGAGFKKHRMAIGLCCLLLVSAVTLLFLTENSAHRVPPTLYAHTSNNQVVALETGGYSWSYGDVQSIADAVVYYEMDYDAQSTAQLIGPEAIYENFFFSTSKNVVDGKNPAFKITSMSQFDGKNESESNGFDDDFIELSLASEAKTYYYNFTVEFDQGTVNYGLRVDKITAQGDEPPFQKEVDWRSIEAQLSSQFTPGQATLYAFDYAILTENKLIVAFAWGTDIGYANFEKQGDGWEYNGMVSTFAGDDGNYIFIGGPEVGTEANPQFFDAFITTNPNLGSIQRILTKGNHVIDGIAAIEYVHPQRTLPDAPAGFKPSLTVMGRPADRGYTMEVIYRDLNGEVMEQSSVSDNAKGDRPLTSAEIDQVNAAFATFLPAKEGDSVAVTESGVDYALNPLSHFFTSSYSRIEDMNMAEFVYYIPREDSVTDEEVEKLKKAGKWLPFKTLEDSPVPFGAISYDTVNKYLQTYGNISIKDMKNKDEALFLGEYQKFYSYASDFDPGIFHCIEGEINGAEVLLRGENASLGLRKIGDRYVINYHIRNMGE